MVNNGRDNWTKYNFAPSLEASGTVNPYDLVTITGNNEVGLAGPGDPVIGYISFVREAGGVTVECIKYSALMTVIFETTPAAGDFIKVGTPDGDGGQRFVKWDNATDSEQLIVGICMDDGTSGTGLILV